MKESRAYQLRDQFAETLKANYVIKAEWEDFDGWLDGFKAKFFVIKDSRVDHGKIIVVKVNESGVFHQTNSCGWTKFKMWFQL